ncbi:hypothetical protein NKH70_32665 [Mesorhizobium sp. M0991]|uniref:hypothetical protein n=1 Tax=Mesorhizobium sp. M0991 TaxID=2957043 RepID=UPI00333660E5
MAPGDSGPFSERMQELIGNDVIITDAVAEVPTSTLGAWAFELPKVYSDPDIRPDMDGNFQKTSCWEAAGIRARYNRNGSVKGEDDHYVRQEGARYNMIDAFASDEFEKLAYGAAYDSLLTERALTVGRVVHLCHA